MISKDKKHEEQFKNALQAAGAINGDGTVKGDFGASLYLLTGLPNVYERVEQYIHYDWIDFDPMLALPLSSGERILVSLAGNLYNGRCFEGYTPMDIVGCCDKEAVELALSAIWMRKRKLLCIGYSIAFADEFAAAKCPAK